MTDKVIENNQAAVMGKIISGFTFSHEIFGEGFYMMDVEVARLSESYDIIPVMVSERLIDVDANYEGEYVSIYGQFRSYNKQEGNRSHLILSLFVMELEFIDSIENRNPNTIFLDGYICKEPVYRTTPLGREIADVLLAVNRAYGKSDYIPCICWGRNARYAGNLTVGSRIQLRGRIQSREYQKRIGEGKVVDKIAYEVSASQMEYIEEEE